MGSKIEDSSALRSRSRSTSSHNNIAQASSSTRAEIKSLLHSHDNIDEDEVNNIAIFDSPVQNKDANSQSYGYKVYSERWLMLFYLSLLHLLSDWAGLSVAPIATLTISAYSDGDDAQDGSTLIQPEALVTVFLIASSMGTALEPWILSRLGLRRTVVLGAFANMIGNLVKSGGLPPLPLLSFPTLTSGLYGTYALYLGFFLVGFAQPLFQCTPALLSASWFPEHNPLCTVPGCGRCSYQRVNGAACKACIVFWALNHAFAEVVQVIREKKKVGGIRVMSTRAIPVAVDTATWTANIMHENNTPVQMYQTRSNADSEWQTIRVSERPEDLTSDNVRALLIYSKSSAGTTNFLPPEIVSRASSVSLVTATAGIVSRITTTKKTKASLKERKDSGESTKRRVWVTKYHKSSGGTALCTVPGCENGACKKVPGLKCVPHIMDRVVEVSVQTGYAEFTIQVKKSFMFDDVDEGMYHTLVFKELSQFNVGGFLYDGRRYAYSEDMFFLAANACSPQEVETDKCILRTPLFSRRNWEDDVERFAFPVLQKSD
jgi:hypothetical protein